MYEKVKPPDKYRCIKLPIQKILKSDLPIDVLERINDAVSRTNIITTNSYFLLRLWVLQKHHNNREIPIITEDTIRMSMKSLVKASAGPKPKGNNLALLQEFQNIGNSIFTGSARANVVPLSITSNTASMDLSLGNYFTLTLANTATTHISASNVQPGQSATLVITTGTNSSASLAPTMLQPSGSAYSASLGSSKLDVLSIVSVASGIPFVVSTKNMV